MKKKMKQVFKSEAYQYFKYAMWTFGGLALELVYAFLLEPIIYGHSMNEFTTVECMIHWSLTSITWVLVAFLILRSANKNLDFQLKGKDNKWTLQGVLASLVLIGLMIVVNYVDLGKLKIVHEFYVLGALKFTFQHFYYLAEVALFTLIVVFGQNSLEKFF